MRRTEKRERPRESFSLCVAYESRQLFLSVYFVRNGKFLTALRLWGWNVLFIVVYIDIIVCGVEDARAPTYFEAQR